MSEKDHGCEGCWVDEQKVYHCPEGAQEAVAAALEEAAEVVESYDYAKMAVVAAAIRALAKGKG